MMNKVKNSKSDTKAYYARINIIGFDEIQHVKGIEATEEIVKKLNGICRILIEDHHGFLGTLSGLISEKVNPFLNTDIDGPYVRFWTTDSSMVSVLELIRIVTAFLQFATLAGIPCRGGLFLVDKFAIPGGLFNFFRRFGIGRKWQLEEQEWIGCFIDSFVLGHSAVKAEMDIFSRYELNYARIISYKIPILLGTGKAISKKRFAIDWTNELISASVITASFSLNKDLGLSYLNYVNNTIMFCGTCLKTRARSEANKLSKYLN